MSAVHNFRWIRVNGSLVISERMPSGYDYRIREYNGIAIVVAEGGITDRLPLRRQQCADVNEAYRLADEWEAQGRPRR